MKLLRPLLLAAVVLLAACSPVYTTRYAFVPPPSPAGQLCASNCQLSAQTCLDNCRSFAAQCDFAQDGGYGGFGYGNRRSSLYSGGYGGISASCNSRNCEERCQQAARTCHTNCGGAITTTQVCTSNCAQPATPPAPVQPAPGTVPLTPR